MMMMMIGVLGRHSCQAKTAGMAWNTGHRIPRAGVGTRGTARHRRRANGDILSQPMVPLCGMQEVRSRHDEHNTKNSQVGVEVGGRPSVNVGHWSGVNA